MKIITANLLRENLTFLKIMVFVFFFNKDNVNDPFRRIRARVNFTVQLSTLPCPALNNSELMMLACDVAMRLE